MGCCQSTPSAPTIVVDVPRDVSSTDRKIIREKSFVEGCKLLPFSAACPASYPFEWLSDVVSGNGYLFAAAFEGIGGAAAAQHCHQHAHEALVAGLAAGMDADRGLRAMWQELDRSYLAGPLPDPIKASVGATGVVVYIDTRNGICYASRLGASGPFVARSKGAFSNVRVEVVPLASTTSHCATYGEVVRQQAARASEAAAGGQQQQQLPPHKPKQGDQGRPGQLQQQPESAAALAAERWQAYALPDELQPGSAGQPVAVRCVGCGYGKQKRLLQLWVREQRGIPGVCVPEVMPEVPFITADCEVTIERMSVSDEMVVLASGALEEVVSPQEAALMVHTFGATKLAALREAFSLTADGEQQQQQHQQQPQLPCTKSARLSRSQSGAGAAAAAMAAAVDTGPRLREGNVASAVVHRALEKVLTAHNRRFRQRLDYRGLQALPLCVDLEALRPPGPKAASAHLRLPPGFTGNQAGGIISKRDIHGDMGLVVVFLDWPSAREGLPYSPAPIKRPAPAALGPSLPGHTPSPSPAQRRQRRGGGPAAAHRWELVRLLVKFRAARRRQLLEAWWGTVEGAVQKAEAAARMAEVAAWRTLGQAVQVTRCGEVFDTPDTPPKQLNKSPMCPSSAPRSAAAAPKLRSARAGATPPASIASISPTKTPQPFCIGGSGGGESPGGPPCPFPQPPLSAAFGRQQQGAQTPPPLQGMARGGARPSPPPSPLPPGANSPHQAAAKISLRRHRGGNSSDTYGR